MELPHIRRSGPLNKGFPAFGRINIVSWITVRTASFRWEAELLQQMLAAYGIPSRIVDLGVMSYMGLGSPAALQVQPDDQATTSTLLALWEEESNTEMESQE